MGAVDFNNVKTGLDSSLRSRSKRPDGLTDLPCRHLLGPRECVCERHGARRPHIVRPPAQLLSSDVPLSRLATVPWSYGAGLAARVGQLAADLVALGVNEVGDALQGRYLAVLPQSRVLWRNSTIGEDRCCFDEGEGRPAHGKGAKVDEMLGQLLVKARLFYKTWGKLGGKFQVASTNPVCEMAVICAVLAHGRHNKAVRKCDSSNSQGMEDGGSLGRVLRVKVKGCAGGGDLCRGVEGNTLGGFACSWLLWRDHSGRWGMFRKDEFEIDSRTELK